MDDRDAREIEAAFVVGVGHFGARSAIADCAHLRQRPASSRDFGGILEGAEYANSASSQGVAQHLR